MQPFFLCTIIGTPQPHLFWDRHFHKGTKTAYLLASGKPWNWKTGNIENYFRWFFEPHDCVTHFLRCFVSDKQLCSFPHVVPTSHIYNANFSFMMHIYSLCFCRNHTGIACKHNTPTTKWVGHHWLAAAPARYNYHRKTADVFIVDSSSLIAESSVGPDTTLSTRFDSTLQNGWVKEPNANSPFISEPSSIFVLTCCNSHRPVDFTAQPLEVYSEELCWWKGGCFNPVQRHVVCCKHALEQFYFKEVLTGYTRSWGPIPECFSSGCYFPLTKSEIEDWRFCARDYMTSCLIFLCSWTILDSLLRNQGAYVATEISQSVV